MCIHKNYAIIKYAVWWIFTRQTPKWRRRMFSGSQRSPPDPSESYPAQRKHYSDFSHWLPFLFFILNFIEMKLHSMSSFSLAIFYFILLLCYLFLRLMYVFVGSKTLTDLIATRCPVAQLRIFHNLGFHSFINQCLVYFQFTTIKNRTTIPIPVLAFSNKYKWKE